MNQLPPGVTMSDLQDILENPTPAMLASVPPTEDVVFRLENMRSALESASAGLEVVDPADKNKVAKLQAIRRRLLTDIPFWERRLKWAKRRDELSKDRPDGCWCLGEGGRGLRHVTPIQESFLEYCSCPDGEAAKDAALRGVLEWKQSVEQYERDVALQRIWGGSGVPAAYTDFSIMSFPSSKENKQIIRRIIQWCDEESWLYLYGDFGRGKTGIAVGILKEMAGRGKTVLFQTVPELLERIKSTYSQTGDLREGVSERDVMESLKAVDVLVLDDLGTERMSDWVAEKLFIIINHRYSNNLRTVITSNISIDELARRVGERIVWRIVERSKVYELRGPNLRER